MVKARRWLRDPLDKFSYTILISSLSVFSSNSYKSLMSRSSIVAPTWNAATREVRPSVINESYNVCISGAVKTPTRESVTGSTRLYLSRRALTASMCRCSLWEMFAKTWCPTVDRAPGTHLGRAFLPPAFLQALTLPLRSSPAREERQSWSTGHAVVLRCSPAHRHGPNWGEVRGWCSSGRCRQWLVLFVNYA